MKLYFFHFSSLVFALILPFTSYSQLNMALQDSMDYNVGVNDVCGWVAPNGKEYALVGLNTGVSIVDVDVTPIKEVAFVPGVDNLWRDINTFGHYAYVSSEARIGLLIINLEFLPDSVQYYSWFGTCNTPGGPVTFQKAHSLAIDENGILFLNGSNLNNGGCILVDVKTHPYNPDCLGFAPNKYSHDCIARDSILYSAEIFDGYASIYDFHDIQNISLLGQVKTPHEFTHNIALSADGKYMFTTDERANSYVTSYDISDKSNIIELDRFRQAAVEGSGAIVHNAFSWQNWLVLAYYSSGTLIVDASRPDNLIEVGNFDSFIGANGGYEGVWGCYVDLPSGKILTSDRKSGLFVFIPNYVRAAFLEGTVVDSITGLPLSGAKVTIVSDEIILPQFTIFDGSFKTGKAVPGTFPITVVKEGYYTKTIQANFVNGDILTPVIKLLKRPLYSFSGQVINAQQAGIPFARIVIYGDGGTYNTSADADGNFLVPSAYEGDYEIHAGIWGQTMHTQLHLNAPQNLDLIVKSGYSDNFDVDLGWTVSGEATQGQWARGVPTGQLLFDMWQCGSPTDSPFDDGIFEFSTGISATNDVALDDVNGGTTMLASPAMDLDSVAFPWLFFDYWLCEFPPNQYLGFTVWITNGIDTSLIEEFRSDTTVGIGSWHTFERPINEFPGTQNNIQILFRAIDPTSTPGDYYLKVHVDNFKVESRSTGTHDAWATSNHLFVYPNPSDGSVLYLKSENGIEGKEFTLKICDIQGRVISQRQILRSDAEKGIQNAINDGIYFLQWKTEKGESGVEKIIVMKN